MRHSVRFALWGVFAGLVMPVGLVIYALLVDRQIDPLHLFLVMVVGGVLGLGVLGWALGTKEDRLQSQNIALRALSDRLAALSTTDPLTGLPNRRALDDRLEDELARARRYGTPMAVVMVDLDHFKRLNDRFGHPTGDEILRHVARVLEGQKRRGDTIARYGGEEFVAILSHADTVAAQGWAERVRLRLGTTSLDIAGTLVEITASFGVASAVGDAVPDGLAFLEAADRALYLAKSSGRNRVAVAPERGAVSRPATSIAG